MPERVLGSLSWCSAGSTFKAVLDVSLNSRGRGGGDVLNGAVALAVGGHPCEELPAIFSGDYRTYLYMLVSAWAIRRVGRPMSRERNGDHNQDKQIVDI